MSRAAAVFVVTMHAVAGPDNAEPDGRRYDLLVFARALDEQDAEQVALRGVGQLGWIEAATVRTGEITNPDAAPDDMKPVIDRARQNGCAIIVYDQP